MGLNMHKNVINYFVFFFFFINTYTLAHVDENNFHNLTKQIINLHVEEINNLYKNTTIFIKPSYNIASSLIQDSVLYLKNDNKFIITITGALAKEKMINQAALGIIICHEIGHILGGHPKQTSHHQSWSSVEGQADYFSTNICMKNIHMIFWQDNLFLFDQEIIKKCEYNYPILPDFIGCLRTASGIMSLQHYFNSKSLLNKPISLHNKDNNEVNKTLQKYPSNQCRIDTFWAGLFNEEKPKCWYKN